MRRLDLIVAVLLSTFVHAALLLPRLGDPSTTQTLGGETRATRGTLGVAILAPLSAVRPEPVAAVPPADPAPALSEPPARSRAVAKSSRRSDRASASAASVDHSQPAPSEVRSAPDRLTVAAPERMPPVGAAGPADAQPLGPDRAVIRPSYPWRARRMGQEGKVLVQVAYDARGRVHELGIAESSGYRLLDREALAAVRRAWAPSDQAPPSAAGSELLEIVFQLDD